LGSSKPRVPQGIALHPEECRLADVVSHGAVVEVKKAKGAPSLTEPDLPRVPNLLSMSLIRLRVSPLLQPASTVVISR
jgi:hypothetical protein